MDCPVCKTTALVMSERQNIEIDYCPQCRGVWLDRGELDKLIERAVPAQATQPPMPPAYGAHPQARVREEPSRQAAYGDHQGASRGHKKKKEGFLSDLFDF